MHRWDQEALSYQRQNEEEGLGEYGARDWSVVSDNCVLLVSAHSHSGYVTCRETSFLSVYETTRMKRQM